MDTKVLKLFSKIFKNCINWISRSKFSIIGAIVVSILFPVLLISFLFESYGIIENPYFGFLLYLIMAPAFVIGVILVFVGAFFSRGREDIGTFTVEYLQEELSRPGRYSRIRRLIYLTVALTLVTVFIVGLVTYGGFHYTGSNSFCAGFCHDIMKPQFVAYQNSPHSKVACSDCHMGKDAGWVERSKFSGIRQIVAVAADSYSRPISSPITVLRPGRQTCEGCHLPEMFHSDRLVVKDRFLPDEKNTHTQTALLLKVGSGDFQGRTAHGIHWHVSEEQEVYYRHTDAGHEEITEVRLVAEGKKDVVYRLEPAAGGASSAGDDGKMRKMDCIDCHNRPTHIFLSQDEALDKKIAADIIPRFLPYIKRQALEAITREYPTADAAIEGIARYLKDWYKEHYPDLVKRNASLLDKAIAGTQQAYLENVFPEMNVTWGTYKSFIGHENGTGCFRCHGKLQDRQTGEMITENCDACHIILAENEANLDLQEIFEERGENLLP